MSAYVYRLIFLIFLVIAWFILIAIWFKSAAPSKSFNKIKINQFEINLINNSTEIEQDSEVVVDVARRFFLKEPPPNSTPYTFEGYDRNSSTCSPSYNQSVINTIDFNPSCGQVQILEDILRSLTPGFFLDCGANDGIFVSNTIWLERKLGWTGLLIEADPKAYQELESINRKAWLSDTCISVTPFPQLVTFYVNPRFSEASGLIRSGYYGATVGVKVQCFPLYTLLLATGRTTIDFFTLDVEGNELEILKNIPFDKITFKILSIEHLFIPGGKAALRDFMESKGYIFYRTIVQEGSGDSVFLHRSVVAKLNSQQLKQMGHEDEEKQSAKRE